MRVNVSADFGAIHKSAVICSDTSFFFGFSLDFSDLLWYGIVLTGTEGSKSMGRKRYTVQFTPHLKERYFAGLPAGVALSFP